MMLRLTANTTVAPAIRSAATRPTFSQRISRKRGAAAAITLALGAIGLYGVMAYVVALRTRELGIRIAIGADPKRLARTVAMGGVKMLAAGVAGGLVLHAAAAPFLRAFLYGVTPADPVTIAAATAVLVATALLASWIPARRAARVDPTVALRAE